MPPRRSAQQKEHAQRSMAAINARKACQNASTGQTGSGNTFPAEVHQESPILKKKFQKLTQKLKEVTRKLRNRVKEAQRAKATAGSLRELNRNLKEAIRKQKAREPVKMENAVKKVLKSNNSEPGVAYLKTKRVITEESREMVRDLSMAKVPDSSINKVSHIVGKWLGIDVKDAVSERSVARMVQEGGIAAKLQLVEEISEANGFTVSGDGTTIKHLNYEAKHITLNVASYEEPSVVKPTTRFFGVTMGPNHKSETQLNSWKELSNDYYDTFNRAFGPDEKHADPLAFAKDMLGLGSDHSEDQKKLNRLLMEWKELSDRIWRGKEFMAKSPLQDFAQTLWEVSVEKIASVGGLDKWDSLSNDAKDKHDQEAYRKLCLRIGQEQWARLPEDARREAQLWVWAGCCMHKEMNSTKGGAAALTAYWIENKLTAPIKLFNKDNAAAVAAGPSPAMDRALSLSEGGAVKLASLAGALFNNKDDKKGLQDTHRDYFRRLLGYAINFPDTSNTRFQSHLLAVAELLVHLPLYIDLLLEVRDCKEKGNFNHMEYNIYQGLQDTPTLTEMATLTLYLLAISYPYMRIVRGSGDRRLNAVELAPVHERVKDHCRAIINNPDLLLGAEADFTEGAMDGRVWERPEAFYTVQRMSQTLPHLRGCVVAFFKGALSTWERFTTEFAPNAPIASLTGVEKKRLFINATNDHNEGALGGTRKEIHRAPRITLRRWNSTAMYKKNDTREYIRSRLTAPRHRMFLRKEARELDGLGLEDERRQIQAVYNQGKAAEKRTKVAEKKRKEHEYQSVLDSLVPELDIETLKAGLTAAGKTITVPQIKLQIEWHRRFDVEKKIPKKTLTNVMRRSDLLIQLIAAAERHNRAPVLTYAEIEAVEMDTEPDLEMDWAEKDEEHDADMEED